MQDLCIWYHKSNRNARRVVPDWRLTGEIVNVDATFLHVEIIGRPIVVCLDCRFRQADFRGTTLEKLTLEYCDLAYADLSAIAGRVEVGPGCTWNNKTRWGSDTEFNSRH